MCSSKVKCRRQREINLKENRIDIYYSTFVILCMITIPKYLKVFPSSIRIRITNAHQSVWSWSNNEHHFKPALMRLDVILPAG